MDENFKFSLDIKLGVSCKHEVSGNVELLLNCFLVVGEVDFILVNSLLEQFTKNIINLKENDKCGEIHGLINDTFVAILWSRENHDQNGRHGKDTDSASDSGLNEYPSALRGHHHATRDSHKKINGDLLEVSDANHENNVSEAESKDSVFKTAQNEDALAFKQGFEDLTEGEGRSEDTEPAHRLETVSESLCLDKLTLGCIIHFGEVFFLIISFVENGVRSFWNVTLSVIHNLVDMDPHGSLLRESVVRVELGTLVKNLVNVIQVTIV